MGGINRVLLALAALVLLVPCRPSSAQSPAVRIETDYLMTLEATCEPGQQMGARLVVNCTGGSVQGPKINGTVIPPTGDWLIPLPDGQLRLDVRGTIKTDDGELVMFEYYGIIAFPKEAMDRALKGEVVTNNDGYFITAPIFTTASKKYGWLSKIQAVGKMSSLQVGKFVKYDIFMVR